MECQRPALLALCALVTALAATSCGDAPAVDEEFARRAVIRFFAAIADNDREEICELLTASGRAQAIRAQRFAGTVAASERQCMNAPTFLPTMTIDIPLVVRNGVLKVGAATVRDGRASVPVTVGALEGTQNLRSIDGTWKIDGFDLVVRE